MSGTKVPSSKSRPKTSNASVNVVPFWQGWFRKDKLTHKEPKPEKRPIWKGN